MSAEKMFENTPNCPIIWLPKRFDEKMLHWVSVVRGLHNITSNLLHNRLFMIIWFVKFQGRYTKLDRFKNINKTLWLYKDFEPILHRTKYVRKSVHFKNTWLHDPHFFQNCGTFQYKISLYWKVPQFWKKWGSCIFLKWTDFTLGHYIFF